MALHKRTLPTPKMPFPGESPTVSLAHGGGQMYGLHTARRRRPAKQESRPGSKKARGPQGNGKAKTKSK